MTVKVYVPVSALLTATLALPLAPVVPVRLTVWPSGKVTLTVTAALGTATPAASTIRIVALTWKPPPVRGRDCGWMLETCITLPHALV